MFCPGVPPGHAVDEAGELVTFAPEDRERRQVTDGKCWWSLPALAEGPGHENGRATWMHGRGHPWTERTLVLEEPGA